MLRSLVGSEMCIRDSYILWPVCRKLLAVLDPHLRFYRVNFLVSLIASPIELHRICGYIVVVFAVIHGTVNSYLFKTDELPLDGPLGDGILGLKQVLYTGCICIIMLFTMLVGYFVGKHFNNYRVFWLTHVLYIPFLLLLLFHGNRICPPGDECPWYVKQTFWRYILLPGLLFILSKTMSVFPGLFPGSGSASAKVISIDQRSGKVFHLTTSKVFEFEAGQYANITSLRLGLTSHPFTISSHPSDEFLAFNIEMVGAWTTQLAETLAAGDELLIQGPFGAAAQNATSFSHLVLVGMGVGATPMLSIANEVMHTQHALSAQERQENQERLAVALVPPPGCSLDKITWIGGSAVWAVGERLDANP
eukprot:TRINITY_DN6058_c0_g1_i2.p1 TRINITY_DN6058_c0_g1~~TRINITY_DN6058_c0_g1_i2.p1  ORF type:complete len:363 (-),score=86.16 TRINITY_DN6058_c0_g1_i2:119-1207(-)